MCVGGGGVTESQAQDAAALASLLETKREKTLKEAGIELKNVEKRSTLSLQTDLNMP